MTSLPQFGNASHSIGLHGVGSPPSQHDKIKKQAQRLVSQAFYGAILKQIHNSPFKSKMFEGGQGGEAFASVLDQHLADRMAGSSNNGLVNSLVARLEHAPHVKSRAPHGIGKTLAQRRIARSAYSKAPAKNRSEHVPANIRA